MTYSSANLNLTFEEEDFDNEEFFIGSTEATFDNEEFFIGSTEATFIASTTASNAGEESWMALRQYYSKVLMGLARNPQTAAGLMGLNSTGLGSFLFHLTSLVKRRRDPGRTVIIILVYSILIAVSLFGNLLVCHVVLRTRRLHTLTNTFLANLAVSDLLMTALNIPFNVARVLLDDWPFGSFMCSMVPFVQVTSVYVSAFTMVAIALDRYQVIVHPLKPRLGSFHGAIIIAVVWLLAALVSLPYAIYSEVVEVFTYRKLTRCQAHYPPPALQFRQWLTLATFLTQYVIPLSITAVAYVGVTRRVWWRAVVGAATQEQLSLQLRAKKKTVKMLLVVVVLFALCWLPLNTYHLVVDFGASVGPSRHSSSIFFICHWFAMSNVCYNPFIYCWLNDHFRAGAKAWLRCAVQKVCCIPLSEDVEEPPGARVSRPRDSITLSSSALGGGSSVRRKIGGSSVRSSSHASDFHVTLDELMISPANIRSNQQRYNTNSMKYSSKRRRGFSHIEAALDAHYQEDDKAVQTDDLVPSIETSKPSVISCDLVQTDDSSPSPGNPKSSVMSCSHGSHNIPSLELPRVEVDPQCILNFQHLESQRPLSTHVLTVREIRAPDKAQISVRDKEVEVEMKKRDKETKINTEMDATNTGNERAGQSPRLLPIPEESPKSCQPKLPHKYLDCRQSFGKINLLGESSPREIRDKILQREDSFVENISLAGEQNKTDRSISKSLFLLRNLPQSMEKKSEPRSIIKAIRANVATSLAKKLSFLNFRASLVKDAVKNCDGVVERPSSPSLCWSEDETSSSIEVHRCIPTTSSIERSDSLPISRRFQNQNVTQNQGAYMDVILPNVVMECSNVCESPSSRESTIQNQNKQQSVIIVRPVGTNSHKSNPFINIQPSVPTPVLRPLLSATRTSFSESNINDPSASYHYDNYLVVPEHLQHCHSSTIRPSSSKCPKPIRHNSSVNIVQSTQTSTMNNSPVFHPVPNMNEIAVQTCVQPDLRTFSTPNLSSSKSCPTVTQDCLQSSRSVTSWVLFPSSSPPGTLSPDGSNNASLFQQSSVTYAEE
ncbi:LOW QUALITY PROTEIN: uncharacterized protein LOC135202858 [Macrobrachium nipponense]|uniref:LOW QUALITY PROTEIN: uncharacterized protein LOC135202858 n=1 Tax=Macrobrachium nipponense TaxID=159736 RepID=UPI0030C7D6DA